MLNKDRGIGMNNKKAWLKGSLSIEAAFVVPICFMLTMSAIMVGFDVYHESYEYVEDSEDELNVVQIFKLKQNVSDLIGVIKKHGDKL